jgi:FAD:protein FMN transferase
MTKRPISTRRDFLRGKSAADALAGAMDDDAPPSLKLPGSSGNPATAASPGDSSPTDQLAGQAAQPYLVHLARDAMACRFQVFFNAGQYDQATEAAIAAFDLIGSLEDQMTVYRATSQIADVNRRAAREPVELEPRLFELLSRAVALSGETGGAFDVTSGPLSRVWGFKRRAGAVPAAHELAAALAHVGSARLELDPARRTVRFLADRVELNFGAIGKGYALDRAAEILDAGGVRDFLWHGGQSSVLARGSRSTGSGAMVGDKIGGWSVGLNNPLGGAGRLAEVFLRDRALATSGSSQQFFRHRGKRYGHILDPRTGWPAEGVFSATVLAPTAAEADALSTAFYVMGVEAALEYCQSHADVAALLLVPSRDGSAVELATAGLRDEDWRRVGAA